MTTDTESAGGSGTTGVAATVSSPPWAVIDAIRGTLGMTQDQFASALGVSRRTVNRWATGHNIPHPVFVRFAGALLRHQQRQAQPPSPPESSESSSQPAQPSQPPEQPCPNP